MCFKIYFMSKYTSKSIVLVCAEQKLSTLDKFNAWGGKCLDNW